MTTIIATKQALVSALTPLLAGVQVSYGDDVRTRKQERLYCGDVEEHSAEPATMRAGRVRMEEDYTLRVLIDITKKGLEAAELRAITVLGVLSELLVTDPKLSTASAPPGILWATLAGYTLSSSLSGEGEHRTLIEADVLVKARNA